MNQIADELKVRNDRYVHLGWRISWEYAIYRLIHCGVECYSVLLEILTNIVV